MSLINIRDGELKDIFDALEEAFAATGTDYYIIGAMASDVWFIKGGKSFGGTKDVDFAVMVGSGQEYESVKAYLKDHKNFVESKGNSFVMINPNGLQVDILPFGEIEIDEAVTVAGDGLSSIYVTGFKEVYEGGTKEVELETGHRFEVATLPAIVLLKLIAFDDRPEQRNKDPRDIVNIIENFFELQPDLVYSYGDLFIEPDDNQTMEDIAAIVIGREIRNIVSSNEELTTRLQEILQGHIDGKEESAFIRQMVAESGGTVEEVVQYLQNVLEGLNYNAGK